MHVGDVVAQGQEIGISGNTGFSAFPHLHFQVRNKEGIQYTSALFNSVWKTIFTANEAL